MIHVIAYTPDDTVHRLSTLEDLHSIYTQDDRSMVWIDIDEPTQEILEELDRVIDVDDAALEDCLYGEQRPRIDEFEDYLFAILYGALKHGDTMDFSPTKLAVFCGERFLITVHHEPLKSIVELCHASDRQIKTAFMKGIDFLFYTLIDKLVDKYSRVADRYEDQLDDLEDRSLSRAADESILSEISSIRRELLQLKHIASSQRDLIWPLAKGECDYVSETLGSRFSHVYDHLTKVLETIEIQRERMYNVRDNYKSVLSNRTNEIMKTLTLFASIVLPLSLIAGIYGMNLPLWPASDRPSSFWIVLGAMSIFGLIFFLIFRRKHWL